MATKRKFTNLPVRVRQSENFDTLHERDRAYLFDLGWNACQKGDPFDVSKSACWAAGWMARQAAWSARHTVVYAA